MKHEELDYVDKEILNMLQRDARISIKEIAAKVFLSSPAVSSRISRLEEQGYIEGYHAVLNPIALGYHIKAFINLEVEPVEKKNFTLISSPVLTSLNVTV